MMSRRISAILLLALTTAAPLRADPPQMFSDTYAAFVETLRTRCTEFDNGSFDAPEDVVSATADFNGDGIADPIVDENSFSCSSSATMFAGGTGGSYTHVFMSNPDGSYARFEFLSHGRMIVMPHTKPERPILVLSAHST